MENLQKLSKMNLKSTILEMIDYLLDNNFVGFINDLTTPPQIEYHIDDLLLLEREYFLLKY